MQFIPSVTFLHTLYNFREAVMRYGKNINKFHANRKYTHLQSKVPEEDRTAFETLVSIEKHSYNYSLTPAFQRAIRDAETAVENHRTRQPRARTAPPPSSGGGGAP